MGATAAGVVAGDLINGLASDTSKKLADKISPDQKNPSNPKNGGATNVQNKTDTEQGGSTQPNNTTKGDAGNESTKNPTYDTTTDINKVVSGITHDVIVEGVGAIAGIVLEVVMWIPQPQGSWGGLAGNIIYKDAFTDDHPLGKNDNKLNPDSPNYQQGNKDEGRQSDYTGKYTNNNKTNEVNKENTVWDLRGRWSEYWFWIIRQRFGTIGCGCWELGCEL